MSSAAGGSGLAQALTTALTATLELRLATDDSDRARRFPAAAPMRQPVHTVYVPADRFHAGTSAQWGSAALASLSEHGPLPGADLLAETDGVCEKLAREPIEDLRIDLEDGYGLRADAEEDTDVRAAAESLASALADGTAPPFVGIRIKSLEPAVRARGVRSLVLFLETLLASAELPAGFRITLPKVTSVDQVLAMTEVCGSLEQAYGLADGLLRFEIQVETPQAIVGPDGTALVAPMIHAAAGRLVGLHFGTYDYTASVGIPAALQSMEHPSADYAKAVMQVAAAGTGVPVSDGSTNVLPVGGTADVVSAWELHARLVQRSLQRGFFQGWDLHPAQLPTRFAATRAFYRAGLPAAARRLGDYLGRVSTGVAEEPATARALAGFLLRALDAEVVDEPGLIAAGGADRGALIALFGG